MILEKINKNPNIHKCFKCKHTMAAVVAPFSLFTHCVRLYRTRYVMCDNVLAFGCALNGMA